MSLLSIVKYLIIMLLSLFLVVDTIAIAILISSNKVLLDSNTYITELERNNLYDKIIEIAVDIQFRERNVIEIENLKTNVTKEQAKSTIHQAFPRDWIKKQADGIIENFISYIKGEQKELKLSIKLKETKPNIATATLQFANETLEKNMPHIINTLIDEQTKEFAEKNNLPCNTLYKCRELCKDLDTDTCKKYIQLTAPENLNLFRKNLTLMFDSMIKENITNLINSSIPDEIDIANELRKSDSIVVIDEIRDKVRLLPTMTNVLFVVAILLIISIALLASNIRKLVLYTGISFVISGIIGIIGFYLLPSLLASSLDNIIKGSPEVGIAIIIKNVIISISTQILTEAVVYTTIAGLIGLILTVFYFIISHRT